MFVPYRPDVTLHHWPLANAALILLTCVVVLLQSELDKGAFGVKDTMAPFLGVCLCPAPPVAVTPEVKRSLS